MTNHYEILGLKTSAAPNEIKAAFRKLAKLYHPDKNPDGREHFNKILKAYETLSDPVLRSTYDYKLNYHLGQAQRPAPAKAASTTKTWSFDEKELKRRQYFNEHYKKNNKSTEEYTAEVDRKKSYNEYKYILFATPIAVALFLLIMRLAMPVQPAPDKNPALTIEQHEPPADLTQLTMGDMPYSNFFGGPVYDAKDQKQLTVKNETGHEVIVCLFTKSSFVRSFYIGKNYSAQASQLPREPLFIRYSSGSLFKYSADIKDSTVSGAFTKDRRFFKWNQALKNDTVTLLPGTGKHFSEIDESEFFKKSKPS